MEHESERLTRDNTKELRIKMGTVTPKMFQVHKDDLPLEDGDCFRYRDHVTEFGLYPKYAIVDKVVDEGKYNLYFAHPGGHYGKLD